MSMNTYILTHLYFKALHALLILYAMLFVGCRPSVSSQSEVKVCEKADWKSDSLHAVAIDLPFLFYPERWQLNNAHLYVLNSKTSPFLTIYSLSGSSYIQWGNIGNGPREFIVPSLCEMKARDRVGIYSNSLNRLEVYKLDSDTMTLDKTFHFPLWNKQRGIPKAYTRLVQYNDSLFVGTSFMPKEISVELLNLKTEKVVDCADFPLRPQEKEYSGPYECKVAVGKDYMVAAYRYVNRLELFQLSPQKIQLKTVIGDAQVQYDLYRQNKDSEMIFHYSDVICGKDKIYALYQGGRGRKIVVSKQ